ncbi:hypothetical protein EJB05_00929 [Eragrostis curvula]|uniref:Uncharacterized protein n=1 Tax=Eragrostis curvula TaxID=38414 RepID=A0A5J9WLM3_9POAL|nr:hypothetical protein EJB05_00929 [Eragrostis curvula]
MLTSPRHVLPLTQATEYTDASDMDDASQSLLLNQPDLQPLPLVPSVYFFFLAVRTTCCSLAVHVLYLLSRNISISVLCDLEQKQRNLLCFCSVFLFQIVVPRHE